METLKDLRENAALTQAELGKLCKVTKQTIWSWETGVSLPYPGHIRRLAEIFHKNIPEMRAILKANLKEASEEDASKELLPIPA